MRCKVNWLNFVIVDYFTMYYGAALQSGSGKYLAGTTRAHPSYVCWILCRGWLPFFTTSWLVIGSCWVCSTATRDYFKIRTLFLPHIWNFHLKNKTLMKLSSANTMLYLCWDNPLLWVGISFLIANSLPWFAVSFVLSTTDIISRQEWLHFDHSVVRAIPTSTWYWSGVCLMSVCYHHIGMILTSEQCLLVCCMTEVNL